MNNPKNIMCQNCCTMYSVEELAPLDDVSERVAPGETMPHGQCPDESCGAVCYPTAASETDLITALWMFIENVTEDDPTRQEQFFALRVRVRSR